MVTIKVEPEYNYYVLWNVEEADYLEGSDLLLSIGLIDRIRHWQDTFDATLNQDYPPDSGFASPEEEIAFEQEGLAIAEQIQAELGNDYEIYYRDQRVKVLTKA